MISQAAARLNYYPALTLAPANPYILEGIKIISYEIVSRLPGAPDVVVSPVGRGDLLTAQRRGYLELRRAGLIEKPPRMVAVQSVNAPPLLEAFRTGAERVDTVPYANSKISAINVPFTGDHALATVRESGGLVVGVSDEFVFDMKRRLGIEEGLWVEPVGAVPVTALAELLAQGEIEAGERIVCIMSSAGFKDTHLAQAEVEAFGPHTPVPFDVVTIAAQVTR